MQTWGDLGELSIEHWESWKEGFRGLKPWKHGTVEKHGQKTPSRMIEHLRKAAWNILKISENYWESRYHGNIVLPKKSWETPSRNHKLRLPEFHDVLMMFIRFYKIIQTHQEPPRARRSARRWSSAWCRCCRRPSNASMPKRRNWSRWQAGWRWANFELQTWGDMGSQPHSTNMAERKCGVHQQTWQT